MLTAIVKSPLLLLLLPETHFKVASEGDVDRMREESLADGSNSDNFCDEVGGDVVMPSARVEEWGGKERSEGWKADVRDSGGLELLRGVARRMSRMG